MSINKVFKSFGFRMGQFVGFGALAILFALSVRLAAFGDDLRLVDAVRIVDEAAVEDLLAAGVAVDARQADGATALHWAIHKDAAEIVEKLLAAGADVNVKNDNDVRPLMLAVLNRSESMVGRLLEAGADPNIGRESAVMTAAHAGNPKVMALLLAHGGSANATEPVRGQTALMWAAAEGHPGVLRLLIKAGANVHASTNQVEESPDARMYSFLLGGRNPDFPSPKASINANDFTALLFAVRNGNVASIRHLLDAGADVNTTTADGMSALLLATVRGWPSVAHLLLEHGADPNLSGAGYTALHWAAGSWETELTVASITPNRDHEWARLAGLTEGKVELVKALLDHGADPNARIGQTPARVGSTKNTPLGELEGASAFLLAAMAGESEVMRLLVDRGADPSLLTTYEGSPLMAAAGLGRVLGEVSVPDSRVLESAQLLVELGALGDVNAVDNVGNTALHYAAYFKRDAVVQLLVDNGAKLEVKNKYGETPLWLSEVVIQFSGAGIYAVSKNTTGDLFRKLGAEPTEPGYTLRPTYWPDVPHT